MNEIAFDIETGPIPDDELEAMKPEWEPIEAPANYTKPETIAAYIEKKTAEREKEWRDRAALSPLTGRILAIGYQTEDGVEIQIEDEVELIRHFWEAYRWNVSRLAGWNASGFDLPFLVRRSWKHGIPVPSSAVKKWGPDHLVDLMDVFAVHNREGRISLNQAAKFFGLPQKKGSGEFFAEMLKTDRAAAEEYLRHDVYLTYTIAQKMGVFSSKETL